MRLRPLASVVTRPEEWASENAREARMPSTLVSPARPGCTEVPTRAPEPETTEKPEVLPAGRADRGVASPTRAYSSRKLLTSPPSVEKLRRLRS